MAADNELQVKISAAIGDLKSGMEEAARSVSSGSSQITSSVNNLNSTMSTQAKSIGDAFTGAFSTINAAAAMFGVSIASYLSVGALSGAINAALGYRESIESLTRAMGITAEQASVLNVALKMIGVSTETYISANMRLAMHVKSNEYTLNQLGVATRDINGNLLSQTEIMQNAITAMGQYKAGADRNQFALYAWGRNAQTIYEIQRLNNRVMTEAAEVAQRYGLVLTDQAVDKMERYQEKLNVMKLLFDAIKIKVGMELLPELTKMSGWFSEKGPAAINLITKAMKLFIVEIDGAITEIAKFEILFKGLGKIAEVIFEQVVEAGKKVANMDFAGAKDQFGLMAKGVGKIWEDTVQGIDEQNTKLMQRTKLLWEPPKETATPAAGAAPGGGGGKPFPTIEAPADLLGKWKSQLEQMQAAEGAFFGLSASKERAFWEEKLTTIKGAGKEEEKLRREVNTEIFNIDKKQAAETLAQRMATLKEMQASDKTSVRDRVEIQDMILREIEAAGAKETSIYSNAVLERERLIDHAAKTEIEDQQKVLEGNLRVAQEVIESKLEEVHTQYRLGNISTSQQLTQTQHLLTERYGLERGTLERIAALWAQYPHKYQEELKKLELAQAKHDRHMESEERKTALDVSKEWDKALRHITSSLNISLRDMVTGTQSFQAQMESIAWNICDTFISAFAKEFAMFVIYETLKLVLGKSISKEMALSKIASSAASAAAEVYDSLAIIPVVGWILAPIGAIAAFAAVMAWGAFVGGKEGFDVDKDQMMFVHAREMVLPAPLAEGIRGMVAAQGGGGFQGGGGNFRVTYNNFALDQTGMRRLLIKNTSSIAKVAKRYGRSYGVR